MYDIKATLDSLLCNRVKFYRNQRSIITRIETFGLDHPCVDDVFDSRDCDGRLCYVGGQDDLPAALEQKAGENISTRLKQRRAARAAALAPVCQLRAAAHRCGHRSGRQHVPVLPALPWEPAGRP